MTEPTCFYSLEDWYRETGGGAGIIEFISLDQIDGVWIYLYSRRVL